MTTRIEATRLIPGRGDVIDDGVVVFDGDTISFAGAASDAPDTPDADVVKTDTVMPGLWECHGHFIGIYTANIPEAFTTRPQLSSMRVTKDANAVLQAGFTSVREMGGLGTFLGRAIDEGAVVGPNVYASGSMLSMTAGHGDSTASTSTSPDVSPSMRGARTTWSTAPTNAGPACVACSVSVPR